MFCRLCGEKSDTKIHKDCWDSFLPIYKHPVRPQTDEKQVRAWKRRHKMVECEPYACTMTAQACQARHARAMKAKKTTKLGTMPILSYEWLALSKCRKCEVLHD